MTEVVKNRYRLQRSLGLGGMSEVFLAVDNQTGQDVAVKIMDKRLLSEPHVLERFRREVQIGLLLDHRNIPRLKDYGETEQGVPYFVMEYIRGTTLSEVIGTRGALPVKEAVRVVQQVLSALSYAYSKGVQAHRDIKPGNIMICLDSDTVKVMDFGIAKTVGSSLTKFTRMYTLAYASPEQLAPTKFGNTIDARTDIYATGILLYEMITGKTLFAGGTGEGEIVIEKVRPNQTYVRNRLKTLPDGVGAIVMKCMALNPNERYQDCQALTAALKTCAGENLSDREAVPPREETEPRTQSSQRGESAVRKPLAEQPSSTPVRTEDLGPLAVCQNGNTVYGIGDSGYIYRSLDRGASWSRTGRCPSGASAGMMASQSSSGVLFLCGQGGRVLYKSVDRGNTWRRAWEDGPEGYYTYRYFISPFDDKEIYRCVAVTGGDLTEVSKHGGEDWESIHCPGDYACGYVSLGFSRIEQHSVFFLYANSGGGETHGLLLFESKNVGASSCTILRIPVSDFRDTPSTGVGQFAVSPHDDKTIYVVVPRSDDTEHRYDVLRTVDSGGSWKKIANVNTAGPIGWLGVASDASGQPILSLLCSSEDSQILYRSLDEGKSWKNVGWRSNHRRIFVDSYGDGYAVTGDGIIVAVSDIEDDGSGGAGRFGCLDIIGIIVAVASVACILVASITLLIGVSMAVIWVVRAGPGTGVWWYLLMGAIVLALGKILVVIITSHSRRTRQ